MAVIKSHGVHSPDYYVDTAVELPGDAVLGCIGYAVDTDKIYVKNQQDGPRLVAAQEELNMGKQPMISRLRGRKLYLE